MYSGTDHFLPTDTVSKIGCISVTGPRIIRQLEDGLDEEQYIQFLTDISPEEGAATFVTDNHPIYRSAGAKKWLSSQSALKRLPWPSQLEEMLPFTDIWTSLILELNYRSLLNPIEDNQSTLLWNDVMECFQFLSTNDIFENAINIIPLRFIHLLNTTE